MMILFNLTSPRDNGRHNMQTYTMCVHSLYFFLLFLILQKSIRSTFPLVLAMQECIGAGSCKMLFLICLNFKKIYVSKIYEYTFFI